MGSDLEADRKLTEQARRGSSAAWRTIYESTCDRLFAFLCYQVGDRDEARDILQETYLQAFRRLESYRGEAPLAVWLRAIALGRSLDWKRVILRRIKRTVEITDATAVPDPALQRVTFESESDALRRALAKLSHHQRAALLLREWEGHSFQEIARLLGCAESTARVHHTRACERMRTTFLGRERSPDDCEWEGQKT